MHLAFHGPGFVGFHFLWVLPMILLLVVGVTVLAIWAIRESARPPHPAGPPSMQTNQMPPQAPREAPLEILARRFASGEITAAEYQKARDLLGGGGQKT
jgi:uncharacterized membrane protein